MKSYCHRFVDRLQGKQSIPLMADIICHWLFEYLSPIMPAIILSTRCSHIWCGFSLTVQFHGAVSFNFMGQFHSISFILTMSLGHIDHMNNASVYGHKGRCFKSSAAPVCDVLEQDSLCTLLQSTQLTNEYQRGICS